MEALTPEQQAALAGTVQAVQGFAEVSGGVAAYRQARANEKILNRIGRRQSQDDRVAARIAMSRQLAMLAANGVEVASGSALDIRAYSAGQAARQQAQTRNRYEQLARVQRARGKASLMAGIISGTNTILGGAARALDTVGTSTPTVESE